MCENFSQENLDEFFRNLKKRQRKNEYQKIYRRNFCIVSICSGIYWNESARNVRNYKQDVSLKEGCPRINQINS